MVAVALGLSASACWGLADFLGGMETKRLRGAVVVLVSQALGLAGLITIVLLTAEVSADLETLAAAAIAGAAGAVGITAFYSALSIGTMSVVAPITATGVIVPVLIGLGEGDRPSSFQAVGMIGMAVGVLLAMQDGELDEEQRGRSRRSIALAVVAALGIGLGLAALDRAAGAGVLNGVMWSRVVSVTLLITVVVAGRVSLRGARGRIGGLVAIGALDTGATALYTVATTEGLLSVAAVASSLYPIITVVLARVILSEKVRSVQAAGIATALIGVGLVAAG